MKGAGHIAVLALLVCCIGSGYSSKKEEEGDTHELHHQAARFDGRIDGVPGRTVWRFGRSHPHR